MKTQANLLNDILLGIAILLFFVGLISFAINRNEPTTTKTTEEVEPCEAMENLIIDYRSKNLYNLISCNLLSDDSYLLEYLHEKDTLRILITDNGYSLHFKPNDWTILEMGIQDDDMVFTRLENGKYQKIMVEGTSKDGKGLYIKEDDPDVSHITVLLLSCKEYVEWFNILSN